MLCLGSLTNVAKLLIVIKTSIYMICEVCRLLIKYNFKFRLLMFKGTNGPTV